MKLEILREPKMKAKAGGEVTIVKEAKDGWKRTIEMCVSADRHQLPVRLRYSFDIMGTIEINLLDHAVIDPVAKRKEQLEKKRKKAREAAKGKGA